MNTNLWRIGVPTLLVVGLISAVVFASGHNTREVTIPAGTTLVAALDNTVSTTHSHPGDAVTLHTSQPIKLVDATEIPEGVVIRGAVASAKGGGRVAGAPELALQFTELEVGGERHPIATGAFYVKGKNDAAESAAEIGGGAVGGGILGRILGGKHGTVPGAVAGAVIGTGVAVATEGDQLVLHEGQRLKIRLREPVTVTARTEQTEEHEAQR